MASDLVDDPSVLEAALALVDEWYACSDKSDSDASVSAPPSETTTPRPRQKLICEDLSALRSTVRQLQQAIARHWPKQRTSGEEDTTAVTMRAAAPDTPRAQARRALHAVQSYNNLLTLTVVENIKLRPFDHERMVDTMRSRLDALMQIGRSNSLARVTATNGPVRELSNTPKFMGVGLQIQSGFGRYLPFKLSLVDEAYWDQMLSMAYGGDEELGKQLAVKLPNEVLGFVARSTMTPLGLISSSGPSAVRRVYEDDGSVLYVYTSIKTAPPPKRGSEDTEFDNLFAGFTAKQAGWTRIRRVQQRNGHRPLVYMESNMSLVMEAKPGWTVPMERVARIWDAVVQISSQQSRSLQALENRIMDLSLARDQNKGARELLVS